VHAKSQYKAKDSLEAIKEAYSRNETDEFISTTLISTNQKFEGIHDDDTISQRLSNLAFLLGLVIGPLIYFNFIASSAPVVFNITHSYLLIIPGGFLVGFGTRLGGGCTSGHGICGIGRLSTSSIIATGIFVAIGMLTVAVLQQFGIYL
jgi:hypothetical protein